MRRDKGFTLVELLVVMAVIAILAGMIFVMASAAQHWVRGSCCRNNLLHLSVQLENYRKEHHGRYPGSPYYDAVAQQYRDGFSELAPNYISPKQLICPDDTWARQRLHDCTMRRYSSYNGIVAGQLDATITGEAQWELVHRTYNYLGYEWDCGVLGGSRGYEVSPDKELRPEYFNPLHPSYWPAVAQAFDRYDTNGNPVTNLIPDFLDTDIMPLVWRDFPRLRHGTTERGWQAAAEGTIITWCPCHDEDAQLLICGVGVKKLPIAAMNQLIVVWPDQQPMSGWVGLMLE